MSVHRNCVSKNQYWTMYNNFKENSDYIANRTLREDNETLTSEVTTLQEKIKQLQGNIRILETPKVEETKPTVNRSLFSRGGSVIKRS